MFSVDAVHPQWPARPLAKRTSPDHDPPIPSVSVAARSGPASPRTAAASDILPPAKASSSGHASPVVHPSSPAAAASWSATIFIFGVRGADGAHLSCVLY